MKTLNEGLANHLTYKGKAKSFVYTNHSITTNTMNKIKNERSGRSIFHTTVSTSPASTTLPAMPNERLSVTLTCKTSCKRIRGKAEASNKNIQAVMRVVR